MCSPYVCNRAIRRRGWIDKTQALGWRFMYYAKARVPIYMLSATHMWFTCGMMNVVSCRVYEYMFVPICDHTVTVLL